MYLEAQERFSGRTTQSQQTSPLIHLRIILENGEMQNLRNANEPFCEQLRHVILK